MMKSRKEGGGRNSHCLGKSSIGRVSTICWICTASALLLVGIQRGLLVGFKKGVNVSMPIFDLPCCRDCSNLGLAKLPEKTGSRGRDDVKHRSLTNGDKFMYYAPHSGLNNQIMELRNALTIAKILNRTLIVPPVLDHHATRLGSCPKRRVLRPHRLRALAWTKFFDLITNSRYTSIADIVDISSITPSKVKTIDLRIFLALWCGIDIKASCGGILCKEFAEEVFVWQEYEACIRLLNPSPQTEQNPCVLGVDNDCTSTVWTMNPKSFNERTKAVEALLESPKRSLEVAAGDNKNSHEFHNVRRRALFTKRMPFGWKAEKANTSKIRLLNILSTMGPNSSAGNFFVLAFGSMFSTGYKNVQSHIDIKTPSGDKDLDDLIHSLQVLPFSSDIVAAGKDYILDEIAQPFYCAQLRLLDGQFKNHWNATLQNLKAQLISYKSAHNSRNSIPMFVMTDLPSENWTKTNLKELLDPRNSYQVHKIGNRNDLIQLASRRVLTAESGFLVGYGSDVVTESRHHQVQPPPFDKIPHVELAMEEVVCSCARLGFSGTHGSTIANIIRDLRSRDICVSLYDGFETLASMDALPMQ
ncbi:hypothetical protein KC19_VG088500 [Ceratodon purpureus]|uniref:O-fucosyltransferase family protein n=1 Tax=Ceratodon purpureus TaxID=3225 RepID=A0A8T0HN79_CERPU|nr:hypothetical protein KC19_VG088500 [Ceratodon purpureus]